MPATSADPAGTAWEAARAWATSGVVSLCGDPAGRPLLPPLHAAQRAADVVGEITRLTEALGRPVRISWEAALAGRASILGLTRKGRTSPNGSCRLISAADGDVALNLPRPDDVSLMPALTLDPRAEENPWQAAAAAAARTSAPEFVERARLLGLAASVAGERGPGGISAPGAPPAGPTAQPCTTVPRGEATQGHAGSEREFTVADLSSLWAGPVAARVLVEAGARVVKVEDPARPDAARQHPGFYSWIHGASEKTEHLDLRSSSGTDRLHELLQEARVVIESSRPRALEQIGLGPEQLPAPRGQVWLSITGHGRAGPARDWTGFGDDCAAAAGLLCRDQHGSLAFCGDAIADPIAGLIGAMAVLRCLGEGGGRLVDVSLAGAAAWIAAAGGPDPGQSGITVDRRGGAWVLRQGDLSAPIAKDPPAADWITTTAADGPTGRPPGRRRRS